MSDSRTDVETDRAPRRCLCPGSYDPVTLGHLDIVIRAAALYDEVVVAVLHNPAKPGRFPAARRVELLEQSLPEGMAVRVLAVADRLLVDLAAEVGAQTVVKGLRSGTDFAYELPMARMNRSLTGLETVFLPGDPALEHVSSSLVSEVASLGGDVTGMVPPPVLEALRAAHP